MTRREKLQEQYEDALFALLMDDLAVEEGKKAYEENERLKADSSFEVPSESRKRCVETIARCCRKKQFQGISNRCYHAFSKVAVIAMLTIMLATAAFAAASRAHPRTRQEEAPEYHELRWLLPHRRHFARAR